MKTAVYLLFTCFISTAAFIGALSARYPLILYVVGFGIWALFIWGYSRRSKKDGDRRSRERLFEEYMRSKIRNDRRQY